MREIHSIKMVVPEKVSSNKAYSGFKHWSIRNNLKDLYHASLLPHKNKIKLKDFPVRITYEFEWKGRTLDTTNQFFMIKMLEDGLVGIGILPDDTPEYVHETISRSRKGTEDIVTIIIQSL